MFALTFGIVEALTFVIATATLVAAFQDRVRAWLWRPDLRLQYIPARPDAFLTEFYHYDEQGQFRGQGKNYVFRLRVLNAGNAPARDVEVYVSEVSALIDNQWRPHQRPAQHWLRWPVLRNLNPGRLHFPVIPPGALRLIDLGFVRDPDFPSFKPTEQLPDLAPDETIFVLAVEPQYLHRGHLFSRGRYRLRLEVAAANHAPRHFYVVMDHSGRWTTDEARMLQQETVIHPPHLATD